MKSLFSAILIGTMALSGAVFAHDEGTKHHEEKTAHYEAPKPTTEADAYKQLHTTSDEIAKVLEKKKLADSDFEAVHEKSYTLKAAAEKLEENIPATKKEQFKTLAHEVEEVHEEAEEHKEEKLRKHFAAFTKALKDYEAK